MYINGVVATIFAVIFMLGLNGMYPSGSTGIHLNDDSLQTVSSSQCPNVSNSDFATLGPPDIPHKIRVTYEGSGSVVSWDVNNPATTELDYDGGNWAYYVNLGYGYLELKVTVLVVGNECTSYHLVYY